MKTHRFTCTLCGKSWKMVGDNPDGHTEVPCPTCLKQTHDHFEAELAHSTWALPNGYINVPPELQALGLGFQELCRRLAAHRLGMPLDKLTAPPVTVPN